MSRISSLLVSLFILTLSGPISAEPRIDGYLSARFGMNPAEVQAVFGNDDVLVTDSETADGDYLIYAQRKQSWITTDLLYVFPGGSERLALVIEIYPGLLDTGPVEKELFDKLGSPSSDNYPESVLTRMQESNMIPAGVHKLSVWNLTSGGQDRETRLMALDKYIRVEYIDNDLMSGN